LKQQLELEQEAAGVKFSEQQEEPKAKPTKSKKRLAEQEEKDLKMIMMTNKQKKLYKKMQYGINKKEARDEELRQKRRKLEKAKAKAQSS
jgi:pescadillo protein